MKQLFLLALILGLLASTSDAQILRKNSQDNVVQQHNHTHTHNHNRHGGGNGWGGWGGNNGWGGHGWGGWGHASTAAEGYLNGMGQLYRGQGAFLMSYGRYLISREEARKLYIENWKLGVRSQWEIKDENKARFRADNPDMVTKEHKRLDMLEKMHALKERTKNLQNAGVIATPPKQVFTYNGKDFASYEALKNSPEWENLKTQARLRSMKYELEQRASEQRATEALQFLSKWNKMDYSGKQNYIADRETEKIMEEGNANFPSKYEIIKKDK